MSFDFALDPFVNLLGQIQEAQAFGVREPTAMSLATASKDGLPTVRAVLFKGIIRGGLSFYTNYHSPKSLQLKENPLAAVLFLWTPLNRQIRVDGQIAELTRSEAEKYFASRPRLSQLGAWASEQSQEISSFQEFEGKVAEMEKKFANQEVPCPPHWGGFHLLPQTFEFWFGKDGRMHQRFVYEKSAEKSADNQWQRRLLSP